MASGWWLVAAVPWTLDLSVGYWMLNVFRYRYRLRQEHLISTLSLWFLDCDCDCDCDFDSDAEPRIPPAFRNSAQVGRSCPQLAGQNEHSIFGGRAGLCRRSKRTFHLWRACRPLPPVKTNIPSLEGVQASAAGHIKHTINTDKTAS